jgi:hypothetical protein
MLDGFVNPAMRDCVALHPRPVKFSLREMAKPIYKGEQEIVHVITGLWFEQSYTGCARSCQGTSFLSQVKSHPDCHWQKATRPMSQAHGEAPYKLTSPYGKWVWALRRIGCRCWGSQATNQ